MTSIPRRCCLRQTTLPFRCVVIGRRYCDSSMDQVERANFEHLAVTCHLPDNLSDSHQQRQLYQISHFDLFISFAICCMSSKRRVGYIMVFCCLSKRTKGIP